MESQQRLHMITTLNEEADQKRLALTHALGAQERIRFPAVIEKFWAVRNYGLLHNEL